ncbi:hypothetical protein [Actinobacillus pleuropneumoniae]|uniref:hypothetical protein n=1 Tax=Actinobacillus pleuropneumoniae TaxID=715 RepID=UPI003F7BB87D
MKYITLLFFFFISSCAFVPLYSIPNSDAKWIHKVTGEAVPDSLYSQCARDATFSILGRYAYLDRLDKEYLDELVNIQKKEGKCLYEKGFIFKTKLFSAYCYRLEDVCNAYKEFSR